MASRNNNGKGDAGKEDDNRTPKTPNAPAGLGKDAKGMPIAKGSSPLAKGGPLSGAETAAKTSPSRVSSVGPKQAASVPRPQEKLGGGGGSMASAASAACSFLFCAPVPLANSLPHPLLQTLLFGTEYSTTFYEHTCMSLGHERCSCGQRLSYRASVASFCRHTRSFARPIHAVCRYTSSLDDTIQTCAARRSVYFRLGSGSSNACKKEGQHGYLAQGRRCAETIAGGAETIDDWCREKEWV